MAMSPSQFPGDSAMAPEKERRQIEATLIQSIQQYENILDLLKEMDKVLVTASPDSMLALNTSFMDLQSQAQAIDQVLKDWLSRDAGSTKDLQSLMDTRKRIMQEIFHLNRSLTVKASGLKSLLAHEMGALRNGRTALGGYRQPQHHQGRFFNGTS